MSVGIHPQPPGKLTCGSQDSSTAVETRPRGPPWARDAYLPLVCLLLGLSDLTSIKSLVLEQQLQDWKP